jgi:FkbM family methyltransferase
VLRIYTCRHGRLAHYKNDTTIGLSLANYGEWAEAEIYLLSRHLRPGDTVLDIGANVGTHSLALSRIVGAGGRVIAIDAQHRIYQLLAMNMIMNDRFNVDCLNALVSSSTGCEWISATDAEEPINFGAVSFRPGGIGRRQDARQLPVCMFTVDSLDLKDCAAMKIDVEGMEIDVFRGAIQTIERCRPLIYFEQVGNRNLDQIWLFFQSLSYDLFWHVANPYNSNNFAANPQNLFGGAVEVNIVAIPRSSTELAKKLGVEIHRIESASSGPVLPDDAVAGWILPADAYSHLDGEAGTARQNDSVDVKWELISANHALHDLQLRFNALCEDRKAAQIIMESQLLEIQRLQQLGGQNDDRGPA